MILLSVSDIFKSHWDGAMREKKLDLLPQKFRLMTIDIATSEIFYS